jgi:hypothetical protein
MVGGGYYEMTKKFWNDWKGRFGETEQVYIRRWYGSSKNWAFTVNLLDLYRGERILSHKFNGDTVDLVIEKKIYVESSTYPYYHYSAKNECVTLKRKDIVTIDFKKKIKIQKDTED